MELHKNSCEESVFDRLYRDLAGSLQNFVYFKSGDKELSYDLTQEAFIKLWQNCGKVPPAKAKSFLYTVANNLFLNKAAHQKVVFEFRSQSKSKVDKQSPQYLLEEKEYGERLANAIANLTEIQRTAFLMSRVEGKKYREIAEILGISEKAAGKRVHDALEALRSQIEKI